MTAERDASSVGDYAGPLVELKQADSLFRRARSRRRPGIATESRLPELRAFIDRIKSTGALLAEPGDRRVAQEMLEYWWAQLLVSMPGDAVVEPLPVLESYGALALSPSPADESVPRAGVGDSSSLPNLEIASAKPDRGADDVLAARQMVAEPAEPAQTQAAQPSAPAGSAAEIEVDERSRKESRELVRVSSLARQWRNHQRDSGYFLTGQALNDAIPYGPKDPEIAEFIVASQQSELGSKRRLNAILLGLVVALLGLTAWALHYPAAQFFETWNTASLVKQIVKVGAPDEQRVSALQELMTKHDVKSRLSGYEIRDLKLIEQVSFPIDFSKAALVNLKMQGIHGPSNGPVRVNFSNSSIDNSRFLVANLTDVQFTGCSLFSSSTKETEKTSFANAILNRADFSDCQRIDNVSFDNANLSAARFSGAKIDATSFKGAGLSRADFTGATLRGCNFDGADLSNAVFDQIATDSLVKNSFSNVSWWLANGWSDDNISSLNKAYPFSAFGSSDRYLLGDLNFDFTVRRARELLRLYSERTVEEQRVATNLLAAALNDWAWYKAENGVELPKAEAEAEEAFALSPDSQYIADTLGYILLQLGHSREAAEKYGAFIELSLDGSSPGIEGRPIKGAAAVVPGPGPQYRYARALLNLDQTKEAKILLRNVEKLGYKPTHERVTLPPMPKP